MGKYDLLQHYFEGQTENELMLSFRQIERIIGSQLPDTAMKAHWWANDSGSRSAHVQKLAWGKARYHATLHAGRRVRFRRLP